MSVHVILVTHDKIGRSLLEATALIFGQLPLPTTEIALTPHCDVQQIQQKLQDLVTQLQNPHGILILTDIFGASPHNIVKQLLPSDNTHVITGLNLPMLLKIMNYANLPLAELTQKALSGGQTGIVCCHNVPSSGENTC